MEYGLLTPRAAEPRGASSRAPALLDAGREGVRVRWHDGGRPRSGALAYRVNLPDGRVRRDVVEVMRRHGIIERASRVMRGQAAGDEYGTRT